MQRPGERAVDLQDEIRSIAEAVGHAFDDLDRVVDSVEATRVQGIAAMIDDALGMPREILRERLKGCDPARLGSGAPGVERTGRPPGATVGPEVLQLILQDVNGIEMPVGRQ